MNQPSTSKSSNFFGCHGQHCFVPLLFVLCFTVFIRASLPYRDFLWQSPGQFVWLTNRLWGYTTHTEHRRMKQETSEILFIYWERKKNNMTWNNINTRFEKWIWTSISCCWGCKYMHNILLAIITIHWNIMKTRKTIVDYISFFQLITGWYFQILADS